MFKIAAPYATVRGFLEGRGWEFQGEDGEMEMDSFRSRETGKRLFVEDISESFPVTFLMGEFSLAEFRDMAQELCPGVGLLEVESSWEGEPTTIVVAMTKELVRDMFGPRTRMRQVPAGGSAPRA